MSHDGIDSLPTLAVSSTFKIMFKKPLHKYVQFDIGISYGIGIGRLECKRLSILKYNYTYDVISTIYLYGDL